MSKLNKAIILMISIVLMLAIVLIPSRSKASSESTGNNVAIITQINTTKTNTNTNKNTTKTNTNTNKNVANTTAKGKVPQTGIGDNVGLFVLVGILSISAVYAYKKIRDYNE